MAQLVDLIVANLCKPVCVCVCVRVRHILRHIITEQYSDQSLLCGRHSVVQKIAQKFICPHAELSRPNCYVIY